MGCIYGLTIWASPETSTGCALLVLRQVKISNKTTSSKPRSKLKGDTLKKWESTLNLRVRAHGYDVELIMKASCNDSYPFGINSSCIYDWFPCDHGSDHDILLWFNFSNNVEHLSSTSQRSSSDSIMFHLPELTPLVSRGYHTFALHLMNFDGAIPFPVITTP